MATQIQKFKDDTGPGIWDVAVSYFEKLRNRKRRVEFEFVPFEFNDLLLAGAEALITGIRDYQIDSSRKSLWVEIEAKITSIAIKDKKTGEISKWTGVSESMFLIGVYHLMYRIGRFILTDRPQNRINI